MQSPRFTFDPENSEPPSVACCDAEERTPVTCLRSPLLKDLLQADMWLNIASANGVEEVRATRDGIEAEMTRTQIFNATQMARACLASDYRTCDPRMPLRT